MDALKPPNYHIFSNKSKPNPTPKVQIDDILKFIGERKLRETVRDGILKPVKDVISRDHFCEIVMTCEPSDLFLIDLFLHLSATSKAQNENRLYSVEHIFWQCGGP